MTQYSTVQYSTVQCSTVQYSTVQCSTVQYSAVQCSAVQCSTVQYGALRAQQGDTTLPLQESRKFGIIARDSWHFLGIISENIIEVWKPVHLTVSLWFIEKREIKWTFQQSKGSQNGSVIY